MLSLVLVGISLVATADGGPSTAADRSAYESARKEAGRDAKAHIQLALWCESHGLGSERLKHLAMAVLYDPSNALRAG